MTKSSIKKSNLTRRLVASSGIAAALMIAGPVAVAAADDGPVDSGPEISSSADHSGDDGHAGADDEGTNRDSADQGDETGEGDEASTEDEVSDPAAAPSVDDGTPSEDAVDAPETAEAAEVDSEPAATPASAPESRWVRLPLRTAPTPGDQSPPSDETAPGSSDNDEETSSGSETPTDESVAQAPAAAEAPTEMSSTSSGEVETHTAAPAGTLTEPPAPTSSAHALFYRLIQGSGPEGLILLNQSTLMVAVLNRRSRGDQSDHLAFLRPGDQQFFPAPTVAVGSLGKHAWDNDSSGLTMNSAVAESFLTRSISLLAIQPADSANRFFDRGDDDYALSVGLPAGQVVYGDPNAAGISFQTADDDTSVTISNGGSATIAVLVTDGPQDGTLIEIAPGQNGVFATTAPTSLLVQGERVDESGSPLSGGTPVILGLVTVTTQPFDLDGPLIVDSATWISEHGPIRNAGLDRWADIDPLDLYLDPLDIVTAGGDPTDLYEVADPAGISYIFDEDANTITFTNETDTDLAVVASRTSGLTPVGDGVYKLEAHSSVTIPVAGGGFSGSTYQVQAPRGSGRNVVYGSVVSSAGMVISTPAAADFPGIRDGSVLAQDPLDEFWDAYEDPSGNPWALLPEPSHMVGGNAFTDGVFYSVNGNHVTVHNTGSDSVAVNTWEYRGLFIKPSFHVVAPGATFTFESPPKDAGAAYPADYIVVQGKRAVGGENDHKATVYGVIAIENIEGVTTVRATDPIPDDGIEPIGLSEGVNSAPVGTVVVGDADPVTGERLLTPDFADADGDPLTFQVTAAKGSIVDNGNGTFTYRPAPHHALVYDERITVVASDGRGATGQVSHDLSVSTVTVINTTPSATISVLPEIVDENGDLTYRIIVDTHDDDGDPVVVQASEPSLGSLTANGDGTYLYRVSKADVRSHGTTQTVTFTLNDAHGGVSSATTVIEVPQQNSPPQYARVSPVGSNTTTGSTTYAVSANDADGDQLTYTITGLSAGEIIRHDNRTFTWTPDADSFHTNTTATAVLTVSDGYGGETSSTIVLVPSAQHNDAPSVTLSEGVAQPDGSIVFTFNTDDPDGDEVVIHFGGYMTGTDSDPEITRVGNTIVYRPAADADGYVKPRSERFTVVAEDSYGKLSPTTTVIVDVPEVLDAKRSWWRAQDPDNRFFTYDDVIYYERQQADGVVETTPAYHFGYTAADPIEAGISYTPALDGRSITINNNSDKAIGLTVVPAQDGPGHYQGYIPGHFSDDQVEFIVVEAGDSVVVETTRITIIAVQSEYVDTGVVIGYGAIYVDPGVDPLGGSIPTGTGFAGGQPREHSWEQSTLTRMEDPTILVDYPTIPDTYWLELDPDNRFWDPHDWAMHNQTVSDSSDRENWIYANPNTSGVYWEDGLFGNTHIHNNRDTDILVMTDQFGRPSFIVKPGQSVTIASPPNGRSYYIRVQGERTSDGHPVDLGYVRVSTDSGDYNYYSGTLPSFGQTTGEAEFETVSATLGSVPILSAPFNLMAAAVDGTQFLMALFRGDSDDTSDEIGDVLGSLASIVVGKAIGNSIAESVTRGLNNSAVKTFVDQAAGTVSQLATNAVFKDRIDGFIDRLRVAEGAALSGFDVVTAREQGDARAEEIATHALVRNLSRLVFGPDLGPVVSRAINGSINIDE